MVRIKLHHYIAPHSGYNTLAPTKWGHTLTHTASRLEVIQETDSG